MGSRKRQAIAKQVAEFKASLGGANSMDDIFAQEDARRKRRDEEHDAALRRKACESEHGTTGLHAYRCPYCDGWHLTSKPE